MTTHDPEELEAETRAFNVELERLLATIPSVHTLPPEETRRARREGRGIYPAPVFLPEARTSRSRVRRVRCAPDHRPGGREPTGTFLHLHGGGWTLGENDMQDPRLQRLARDTGLTVVSVGYRLAPENPIRLHRTTARRRRCGSSATRLADIWARRSAGHRRRLGWGASGGGHASPPARPARDHRWIRRRRPPVRRLRPVDVAQPATVGGPQPGPVGTDHHLVRRPVPARLDREQRRDPDISPLFADLRTCRRRSSRSAPRIR